ncbi:hypothetical protein RF11_12293 [Thelohanellus kitauei]|uniref:Uncharacterized protein n=1 Tax=Thelohanellus kitauei TaxID=669202 RepID=A0A0C2MQZ1_THEKT|nr:hypothetical protein RF11_12293 [Thelohanellus kitauei]
MSIVRILVAIFDKGGTSGKNLPPVSRRSVEEDIVDRFSQALILEVSALDRVQFLSTAVSLLTIILEDFTSVEQPRGLQNLICWIGVMIRQLTINPNLDTRTYLDEQHIPPQAKMAQELLTDPDPQLPILRKVLANRGRFDPKLETKIGEEGEPSSQIKPLFEEFEQPDNMRDVMDISISDGLSTRHPTAILELPDEERSTLTSCVDTTEQRLDQIKETRNECDTQVQGFQLLQDDDKEETPIASEVKTQNEYFNARARTKREKSKYDDDIKQYKICKKKRRTKKVSDMHAQDSE